MEPTNPRRRGLQSSRDVDDGECAVVVTATTSQLTSVMNNNNNNGDSERIRQMLLRQTRKKQNRIDGVGNTTTRYLYWIILMLVVVLWLRIYYKVSTAITTVNHKQQDTFTTILNETATDVTSKERSRFLMMTNDEKEDDENEDDASSSSSSSSSSSAARLLSPKAYPVYGTYVEYKYQPPVDENASQGINHVTDDAANIISAVYAIPSSQLSHTSPSQSSSSQPTSSSSSSSNKLPLRGIVLLLHACTHSANKFFSSSPSCPGCVGLAEELEIVRTVLQRNYVALAVTCGNPKTGCWSIHTDVNRLQYALHEFIQTTEPGLKFEETDRDNHFPTVYVMGASSGGHMAAHMLLSSATHHDDEKKDHGDDNDFSFVSIDGALVMVMGLPPPLIRQLQPVLLSTSLGTITSLSTQNHYHHNQQQQPQNEGRLLSTSRRRKRLYFAPMTKDMRTTKLVRDNVRRLVLNQNDTSATTTTTTTTTAITLDETSCGPLPVTINYLWNRVVGMTKEAAQIIIARLIQAGHIDPMTGYLIVDPTRSNWRDIVVRDDKGRDNTIPQSLQQPLVWEFNHHHNYPQQHLQQQQQGQLERQLLSTPAQIQQQSQSQQLLWNSFDLTPGRSPLAKALHRAWAYHEYCSEAVNRALDFFEAP